MFLKKTLAIAVLMGATTSIFAQGLVLNDQNLRTDLNWLNQQGVIQISTSTWPMSGDEIQRVLSQAKVATPAQQKVIESVRAHLDRENTMFKARLFAESDQKQIPQAFGDQEKAQYQAGLEFNAGGENWDVRLRVNGEKDPQIDNDQDVNVEGSYIAGKLWVFFSIHSKADIPIFTTGIKFQTCLVLCLFLITKSLRNLFLITLSK
jgi:hypothetical protein